MSNTAEEIARYIITEFQGAEDLITNLKVQKLLYYIQGWHLGLYQTSVFEEDFEAWVHGPVVREVYDEYKFYNGGIIINPVIRPKLSDKLKKHIGETLEYYGKFGAFALEKMTHEETPWVEARGDLDDHEHSQNIISKDTMKAYFAKLAKRNEENHNYVPNEETRKVLEESRKGIGVKRFNSVEELYEDLGI